MDLGMMMVGDLEPSPRDHSTNVGMLSPVSYSFNLANNARPETNLGDGVSLDGRREANEVVRNDETTGLERSGILIAWLPRPRFPPRIPCFPCCYWPRRYN